MRNIISTFVLSLWLIASISNAQDITNTLGTNGVFKIKDGSSDYLTLSQSTGEVNILKTLRLENTTSPTTGVIFKGADRFLHNYGANNTFIGINSGNFTMTGSNNTANGVQSLYSNTTGYNNTALGFQSILSSSSGYENTAIGVNSLYSTTTGYQNTALGVQSLFSNSSGYWNTALGLNSLYSNTTGHENTAVGLGSLQLNKTGFGNTAVGHVSLISNTTGSYNTANGIQSLYSNTTGSYNTANGNRSLYSNTTGFVNTANGDNSLYSNTTGSNNTAIGTGALFYNTTGSYNTALGNETGSTITTGSNLTCIGYNAEPTSATATNEITLGNGNVLTLRCNTQTITSLSDARDKKNINDLNLGIDFLMKIKPRQFNWDKREWYDDNTSNGSKMKEKPTAGFIAQELDEAQTTANAEWLNLVLKSNPEKWEATPGNLLPIMVKAIQELKAENEQLKIQLADVGEIKEQIAEIKTLKAELKEQINILKASNNSEEIKFSSIINERIDK